MFPPWEFTQNGAVQAVLRDSWDDGTLSRVASSSLGRAEHLRGASEVRVKTQVPFWGAGEGEDGTVNHLKEPHCSTLWFPCTKYPAMLTRVTEDPYRGGGGTINNHNKQLLRASHVPSTLLRALHGLTHSIFTVALRRMMYRAQLCPPFSSEGLKHREVNELGQRPTGC